MLLVFLLFSICMLSYLIRGVREYTLLLVFSLFISEFICMLYYLIQGIREYIDDIYSFAVITINIFIECNENISIFTSAKHE